MTDTDPTEAVEPEPDEHESPVAAGTW